MPTDLGPWVLLVEFIYSKEGLHKYIRSTRLKSLTVNTCRWAHEGKKIERGGRKKWPEWNVFRYLARMFFGGSQLRRPRRGLCWLVVMEKGGPTLKGNPETRGTGRDNRIHLRCQVIFSLSTARDLLQVLKIREGTLTIFQHFAKNCEVFSICEVVMR